MPDSAAAARKRGQGREMEEALLAKVHQQHALLDAIFHSSNDPIYSVDGALRFTSFNAAFMRMVEGRGGAAPTPAGSVLDTLRSDEERGRLRASLERSLAGERFVEHVNFATREGAEQWFEIFRTPIRGADGAVSGVAVYARDVTQRVRDQAEARDINEELERRIAARAGELAAANRELEAFAYSVSHDLRAPLRAIDGFSRIIGRDYAAGFPEKAQQHLARIRGAAQRMGALIEGLLEFSRLGRLALRVEEHEMGPIVAQVIDDLAADREGREVEFIVGDLGRCRADRRLLMQVIANLLGNALKYTRTRSAARIEVGAELREGRRTWYVADNGVGFDMRHAARLFGVFQRLHREEEYEGTGVGLALAQRIVERHGGRIWADAIPELGATFYFTLEGR